MSKLFTSLSITFKMKGIKMQSKQHETYEDVSKTKKLEKSFQQFQNDEAQRFFDLTEKYQQKLKLKMTPGTIGYNDETDAFRHSLMMAYYTLKYGDFAAHKIGDFHEDEGEARGQDPKEKNMDLWNNAIGRQTAKEIKKEMKGKEQFFSFDQLVDIIAVRLRDKIKNGELITDINDKRDFETSPLNGRIFTRENINEMTPEEYRANEKLIDNELKHQRILSDADAKKAVASGDLIFVNSYERNDGTKVKGYYRHK